MIIPFIQGLAPIGVTFTQELTCYLRVSIGCLRVGCVGYPKRAWRFGRRPSPSELLDDAPLHVVGLAGQLPVREYALELRLKEQGERELVREGNSLPLAGDLAKQEGEMRALTCALS
jgi:hypothetical protein